MKRILHKLPFPILVGLCLVGCDAQPVNLPEKQYSEPEYYKIDTVYVLNAHPSTHTVRSYIWATDKSGTDFQGSFSLSYNVVFPQTGDIVVVKSAPKSPLDNYQVIRNITAEKRKNEYMKTK